jgi:hypothetical protein
MIFMPGILPFLIVSLMVLPTGFPNAVYVQAGGPDDSEGCYELGYNDGQDNGCLFLRSL